MQMQTTVADGWMTKCLFDREALVVQLWTWIVVMHILTVVNWSKPMQCVISLILPNLRQSVCPFRSRL